MSSHITKLPKELLALIFNHLTKANDRRRAAQVCKLFYDIIRHQSTLKRDNKLRMNGSDSNKSPIRVFKKSKCFPFSKLDVLDWHQNVVMESDFWSLHGPKISEIIFSYQTINTESVLSTLSKYFPNLKILTIECRLSKFLNADNLENILLPIEELNLGIRSDSLEQTMALLHCSSQLKKLEIREMKEDSFDQMLPWLEKIESSRMFSHEMEFPLGKLINLPSKVDIDYLTIHVDETPKTIREFFKKPRTIETLYIQCKFGNEEFDDVEENRINFTRDQVKSLFAAKAIKNVDLMSRVLSRVLEFEGSLDFLARLPGLENIYLDLTDDLPNPLYPFYWSSPETAHKIRSVDICFSNLAYLDGLSSLTSIRILDFVEETMHLGLSSNDIQTLIRYCPNLKTLVVPKINATDADLIGHENLLPFSSFKKLECLNIMFAPNITSEAFKSAFKFPNLKTFTLEKCNSSEEQPFNQHVAKLFTQNCPNLENLEIYNCPMTEEGFDILIRHLPYLGHIWIELKSKENAMSKDKIKEFQTEFPYINIRVFIAKD